MCTFTYIDVLSATQSLNKAIYKKTCFAKCFIYVAKSLCDFEEKNSFYVFVFLVRTPSHNCGVIAYNKHI